MIRIILPCSTELLLDDQDAWVLQHGRPYSHDGYCRILDSDRRWHLCHRLILGVTERGQRIDHINGNGFDNRRENLRLATASQNAANSGKRSSRRKYKGVSDNRYGRFTATCGFEMKNVHLGTYDTEEMAALAYDIFAYQAFGEFARLNGV